jgi:hypothetical protein
MQGQAKLGADEAAAVDHGVGGLGRAGEVLDLLVGPDAAHTAGEVVGVAVLNASGV